MSGAGKPRPPVARFRDVGSQRLDFAEFYRRSRDECPGLSVPDQALTVVTDEDEQVTYEFAELDELAHAYAVTIHRPQGSEYPAMVIPLTTASWPMLQRNLLCTGTTRARKLLILAGPRPGTRASRPHPRRGPPPHRAHPPPQPAGPGQAGHP